LQIVTGIHAHKTLLSKLTINQTGTLLASSSTKGTVIRVFSLPESMDKSIQFRRGSYPATVHSISFSIDSSFLCTSSDTGTVHIFKIDQATSNQQPGSSKASVATGMMASYLPELLSDMWDTIPIRSFASLKLSSGITNLCGLNQANTVVMVVSADGYFCQYNMDPKVGGELKLSHENQIAFLKEDVHFVNTVDQ